MTTVGISELRANLPKLVKKTSDKLDRIVVTVAGRPKAVLLSLDELESLEETAEILATPEVLASIKKGQEQIKKGQGITLAQLEEKYFGKTYPHKRSRKRL